MPNEHIDYNKLLQNQPTQKLDRQQKVGLLIILLLFVGLVIYTALTQSNKPHSISTPELHTENQTYNDVLAFIKEDDTDNIPYKEGFNCVDSVFRIWRNAQWQGITAIPIKIQFEVPPHHMVIGFPTIDKGDVFFETLSDRQIFLTVGSKYNGNVIKGFYYMDAFWVPLAGSPEYDYNDKIE